MGAISPNTAQRVLDAGAAVPKILNEARPLLDDAKGTLHGLADAVTKRAGARVDPARTHGSFPSTSMRRRRSSPRLAASCRTRCART